MTQRRHVKRPGQPSAPEQAPAIMDALAKSLGVSRGELRKMAEFKFTPILMLTTESAEDKKQAGKQAGATGWICKPFNPEVMLKTIAKVLPA